VLARTPLATWAPFLAPDPTAVLAVPMGGWAGVVRRGLARATAAQGNAEWAVALVDLLWPRATAQRPGERLLLESLYETLAPAERAGRAVAVLRSDPKRAGAAGGGRLLGPWPPAVAAGAGRRGVGRDRRCGAGRRAKRPADRVVRARGHQPAGVRSVRGVCGHIGHCGHCRGTVGPAGRRAA